VKELIKSEEISFDQETVGGGCSEMVTWREDCSDCARKQGGLGVINLGNMKKALLGKWLWRWF